MGGIGTGGPSLRESRWGLGLLWASLVPLLLLLHPYSGLVQDARIYIGRGVADRDPLGIGRDMMFAHDEQTGFSLMRGIVDAALGLASPGTVSLVLALVGGLLWLAGGTALCRSLARGRVAWAAIACALVLPASYGAWNVFRYAEAIATPRIFAQAAVLGGLAALVVDRRVLGTGLLVVAAAFHPLIALPGLVAGGVLLVRADIRWLLAASAALAGVAVAAALGLPLVERLVRPMDATWLAILRARSAYLFPSLWPTSCLGPIVGQAATVAVAAVTAPRRVRTFLIAVLVVAVSGVVLSWLLGDRFAVTLIVQIQPWRSLWLLSVVGNAALALAAAGLWRGGSAERLVLAMLVLARLAEGDFPAVGALAVLALAVLAAGSWGAMPRLSKLAPFCAGIVAIVLGLAQTIGAGVAERMLFRSAEAEGGQVSWPMIVGLGVHVVPLVVCIVAVALLPAWRPGWTARLTGAAAILCAFAAAVWLWDARPADRRVAERIGGDQTLRTILGSSSGEVLWVDEDSQNWFLLGRPAFLNGAQAGPILFSRDLAVEWANRVALLLRLGLARPEDAAPWADQRRSPAELTLSAEGIGRFCADRRRPAAIVAAGDQRAAAPAGSASALWRPPLPVRRLVADDEAVHWRVTDLFTVIRCREAAPAGSVTDGPAPPRDARSFG